MLSIEVDLCIQYSVEIYNTRTLDNETVPLCFMHAVKHALNNEKIDTEVTPEIVRCIDCERCGHIFDICSMFVDEVKNVKS